MIKDILTEIKEWIELARKVDKERKEKDRNLLFDIHPVENFASKLENTELNESLNKEFIDMFNSFCKRIMDSAQFESRSGRVVESLRSISETMYLFDFGYEIATEMLIDYSTKELTEMLDFSKNVDIAYGILARKKGAIYKLLDPFTSVYINISDAEKNLDAGYKLLRLLDLTKNLPYEKFKNNIERKLHTSSDEITKQMVKDEVFGILNREKLFFQVKITDRCDVLFDNIKSVIPEFQYGDFTEEYREGKELIDYSFSVFGSKNTITVSYGDGHKGVVNILNPLIETHGQTSRECK